MRSGGVSPLSYRAAHMKPQHAAIQRTLGHCLTLGTVEAWFKFGFVAAARLSEAERAALAFAALRSLGPEQADAAAAAALGANGAPLPAFLGGMDEARSWASYANRSELKAHALAAFEAMNATDRAAFFRHITEKEAVA